MKIVNTLVIQLLFFIGCSIYSHGTLFAKEVDGLFEILVPIEDQSVSKRRRAARQGLKDVIVRISGQSIAATNTVLKSNLVKSSAYIQRYLYREIEIADDSGKMTQQLMLNLFFDEISIRNLLKDAGLPLWGSNRPEMVVWIAIGDQRHRFLMGTEERTSIEIDKPSIDFKGIVNRQAKQRGLPLLIPLMDLEDAIAIDVGDVWGRFVMPIRNASTRYKNDAILAAQIMQTDETWLARWLLLLKGQTLSWEHESESIETALTAGIDSATDLLAEQYAVFDDGVQNNELLISVSNIKDVQDYAQVMDYLQNLTSIHRVHVAKVSSFKLLLRVNLIGKQEAMLQAVSLNNQLILQTMPEIDTGKIVTQLPALSFRWTGQGNTR